MSSNINKSALELEQFKWVMAKTCNETHVLLSGKASGKRQGFRALPHKARR